MPSFELKNCKLDLLDFLKKCKYPKSDFSRIGCLNIEESTVEMFTTSNIRVDEKGCVASSVSATILSYADTNIENIDIDSPFMFFIIDKKFNLILFHGIINKIIL